MSTGGEIRRRVWGEWNTGLCEPGDCSSCDRDRRENVVTFGYRVGLVVGCIVNVAVWMGLGWWLRGWL